MSSSCTSPILSGVSQRVKTGSVFLMVNLFCFLTGLNYRQGELVAKHIDGLAKSKPEIPTKLLFPKPASCPNGFKTQKTQCESGKKNQLCLSLIQPLMQIFLSTSSMLFFTSGFSVSPQANIRSVPSILMNSSSSCKLSVSSLIVYREK